MSRITFLFDPEKDAWNIWSKATNSMKRFGNPSISQKYIEICKEKKFQECKQQIIKHNQLIYESNLINEFIHSLNISWSRIENEFFSRLEKITGKPLNGNFKAYITTIGTCPYNFQEKWFMVSIYYSLPKALSSIGHELLHLHFHEYYFNEIEKKIGTEKTHDLREALTVLLNLEFKDLWFIKDEGYEQHKQLREFISQEWKKEKNFNKLIEKCIEHLK